ncbi:hypothetical protein GCM10022415_13570 [Knoellia locipacati]|uniref:Secreted protein n=1 Tax=Knoellia locipacati TaxID=882824 RepID=A0A512SZC0_9MICO|nr:hypothetical protein [Knoellia locipacati]GEQ13307.1 hypothetical protein KLO01_13540 [Knoellia locipacati]
MKMASKFVSAAAVAAMASVAVVTMAAPAQAADHYLYSASGKSYGWYDDPNNRIVMCDMVNGDGDGATASVQGGGWAWGGNLTYNGCVADGGIADGVSVRMTVCDWVWSPAQQMRTTTGCRNEYFTS